MKQKILNTALIAAALAAAQAPAYALDTDIDWLKISGFGTLAMTYANIDKKDGAYFAARSNDLTGASNSWNGGADSKLGLQFSARINPALSATVQLLSLRDAAGDYRPTAEWANLKYEFTPDIAVRIGRVGLPAFLISDYLNVGYAQPWIRPPVSVYKTMGTTHVDGADAIFKFHSGETTITVQPAVGESSFPIPIGGAALVVDVNDIVSVNLLLENGPWTFRYANIRETMVATSIGVPGAKDNYSNLGLVYDEDNWLVQSEYVWRTTNDIGPGIGHADQKMGYVTTGYRFGKVMPNITYSRFLDGSTTGVFGTSQDILALGVRWDFRKNMALKAQWDHVTRPSGRPGVGSIGQFNTSPGSLFSQTDDAVNVLAVGLDFVF